MLVSIPKTFKSKVAALEESKDLTMMTLQELVNAFQAFEVRRQISLEERTKIALQARLKEKIVLHHSNRKSPSEKKDKEKTATSNQRQQAEATNTVVYLQNTLPKRALNKMTPYEAWHHVKPAVDHLRIFGNIFYIHALEAKRSKLEPRAEVQVARNIKFDENAKWNWESNLVETTNNRILGSGSLPEAVSNGSVSVIVSGYLLQIPMHLEYRNTSSSVCIAGSCKKLLSLINRTIRAVAESLLENHFTGLNMDDLFERFAKKRAKYLERERC
ncbi:Uncharacterized protein TCM_006847 [Theobroma cacao]|uniref:Uncharacterized protein n=1 Tax=Theobroma cacao TaxID=3641 RepID=A0A061E6Q6_THECC|nr:Uncharacterized protein TCM_006847 [Theobroma cacao]